MSSESTTPVFQPTPIVMGVGLEDRVAARCARLVEPTPFVRVKHAAAALERMLVTRPLVVVLGHDVPVEHARAIYDAAAGLATEVLSLDGAVGTGYAEALLRTALQSAEKRRSLM